MRRESEESTAHTQQLVRVALAIMVFVILACVVLRLTIPQGLLATMTEAIPRGLSLAGAYLLGGVSITRSPPAGRAIDRRDVVECLCGAAVLTVGWLPSMFATEPPVPAGTAVLLLGYWALITALHAGLAIFLRWLSRRQRFG